MTSYSSQKSGISPETPSFFVLRGLHAADIVCIIIGKNNVGVCVTPVIAAIFIVIFVFIIAALFTRPGRRGRPA